MERKNFFLTIFFNQEFYDEEKILDLVKKEIFIFKKDFNDYINFFEIKWLEKFKMKVKK